MKESKLPILLSILLIMGFWFLWQSYMAKKYPEHYKKPTKSNTLKNTKKEGNLTSSSNSVDSTNKIEYAKKKIYYLPKKEQTIIHNDNTFQVTISSHGMALKTIMLKEHFDRNGKNIIFDSEIESFFNLETLRNSKRVFFNLKKTSNNTYEGTNPFITKKISFYPDKFQIDIFTRVKEANSVSLVQKMELKAEKSSVFFLPNYETQIAFIKSKEGLTRERLSIEDTIDKNFNLVDTIGLSWQYYGIALVDQSSVLASSRLFRSSTSTKFINLMLEHKSSSTLKNLDIIHKVFIGPKKKDLLTKVDARLSDFIDYGFFGFLAELFLSILNKINSIVLNYGISIILLTIIVRFVLVPFNLISYKSMKNMQKIAPELKNIKSTYKDDKKLLNQKTMELMKNNKVNPVGGCLPMLMQFPVFIALYQVLGQSVELYKAPFFWWIKDLSLKDPYYILPVLMGIAMFVQQKINPSHNMDKNMQKMMTFMPIIFVFFVLSLPSGLTLYILVSTLFGIAQQTYFLKT